MRNLIILSLLFGSSAFASFKAVCEVQTEGNPVIQVMPSKLVFEFDRPGYKILAIDSHFDLFAFYVADETFGMILTDKFNISLNGVGGAPLGKSENLKMTYWIDPIDLESNAMESYLLVSCARK